MDNCIFRDPWLLIGPCVCVCVCVCVCTKKGRLPEIRFVFYAAFDVSYSRRQSVMELADFTDEPCTKPFV